MPTISAGALAGRCSGVEVTTFASVNLWTLQRVAVASTRRRIWSSCDPVPARAVQPHFWHRSAAVTWVFGRVIASSLFGKPSCRQCTFWCPPAISPDLAGQWWRSGLSRLPLLLNFLIHYCCNTWVVVFTWRPWELTGRTGSSPTRPLQLQLVSVFCLKVCNSVTRLKSCLSLSSGRKKPNVNTPLDCRRWTRRPTARPATASCRRQGLTRPLRDMKPPYWHANYCSFRAPEMLRSKGTNSICFDAWERWRRGRSSHQHRRPWSGRPGTS